MKCRVTFACDHCDRKCHTKEEDATVWARCSSAQFDQGAGRHVCNNPYNQNVDRELFEQMQKERKTSISHSQFLDLIAPSFSGIDDAEDMAAILARTHMIVLTDHGIYWRLALTSKSVEFIAWSEDHVKDLIAESQRPIFQNFKRNPDGHTLPSSFHEDALWSQELLRRLLNGEAVPRTVTIRGWSLFGGEPRDIQQAPWLIPERELALKVKQEKFDQAFKRLRRSSSTELIDLDPSPVKKPRSSETASSSAPHAPPATPMNPDNLPALEQMMDEMSEENP